MDKKINLLKDKAYEIIAICIEDIDKKGPNVNILQLIRQEFEEIIDCIEHEERIRVLNVRKQILSSRIISDSADFNFNKELFMKIADFSSECEKLSKNYLKILYNY